MNLQETERFYDILQVRSGKCPTDCRMCEEICTRERGKASNSGIIKFCGPENVAEDFHSVTVCHQCSQPACLDICPTGAIIRDETEGVVRVVEDKCLGCGLCTLGCSYGGIQYDPRTGTAFKCDLCEGAPKCVDACPHGILSFVKSRPIITQLHDDPLTPATSLCQGCGAELGIRFAQRILGPDIITFGGPGCGAVTVAGAEMGTFRKGPSFLGSMTNLPSIATGVARYYERKGKEVTCVIFAGDGLTADVGFQPLSVAAERGENILYICYDNEAYMNTGIQRSSTTPFGAWTTTTPVGTEAQGKEGGSKNLPLIMTFHGIPYAATASIAFPEDFADKLQKAKSVKDGLRYIHLLAPCPTGWRHASDLAIELGRAAVETNYFPLWEAEHGRFRITHQVEHPRPIKEFTQLQGRFKHLKKDRLARMQEIVNDRFNQLMGLTKLTIKNARDA